MTGGGTSPWGRRGFVALCLLAPCLFEAEVLLLIRSGRPPGRTAAIPLRGPIVPGTLAHGRPPGRVILFRRRRHVKDAAAARLKQLCEIHRARVAVRRVVGHSDGTRCGEFLVRAWHGGEHPVLRRHGPAGAGADEPSAAPNGCRTSG